MDFQAVGASSDCSASKVGYNRRNEEKETFLCEICVGMLLSSRQTMVPVRI
jgi:hypothetical protein